MEARKMKVTALATVLVVLGLGLAAGAYLALKSESRDGRLGSAASRSGAVAAADGGAASVRSTIPDQPPVLRGPAVAGDDAPVSRAELAALRQDVAQLRAALGELRRRASGVDMASAEVPVVEEPMSPAHARAEEEAERRAWMNALEAAFLREPTDAVWAASTSAQVEEALAGLGAASGGIRDLECRASTCRLEISGDMLLQYKGKALPFDQGLRLMLRRLGETLTSASVYRREDGNAAAGAVLFLSRDPDSVP